MAHADVCTVSGHAAVGVERGEPAEDVPTPTKCGHMQEDEDDGDHAGDALQRVARVGFVLVVFVVPLGTENIDEAEDCVEGDTQPKCPFDDFKCGDGVDEVDFVLEEARSCFGIYAAD